MAQLPCIGLYKPCINPPFGDCAMYFDHGVKPPKTNGSKFAQSKYHDLTELVEGRRQRVPWGNHRIFGSKNNFPPPSRLRFEKKNKVARKPG